jgi:uncharacterized membrane protein (UPF0127 family)
LDARTLLGPRGIRIEARVPTTRRERRRGLLGERGLGQSEGLLLERTRSVHTVGMLFEVAVVLLDEDLRVRRVVRLLPGRVLLPRVGVRHVLECAPEVPLRPGDRLTSAG